MSAKRKSKEAECAYCGVVGEVTKDHVIPRCLFVPPYPPDLVTVNACETCNNVKSLNDSFLRDMLALDLFGSTSPVAQTLLKTKIISALRQDKSVLGSAAITQAHMEPLFTKSGVYLGHHPSFPIDGERVTHIFSMIVRGLYYKARKQRLPENYNFEVLRYHPWDFRDVWNLYNSRLHLNGPHVLGNVFGVGYVFAQEDPCTTTWLMWFYESVYVSVSAVNPALEHPDGLDVRG